MVVAETLAKLKIIILQATFLQGVVNSLILSYLFLVTQYEHFHGYPFLAYSIIGIIMINGIPLIGGILIMRFVLPHEMDAYGKMMGLSEKST